MARWVRPLIAGLIATVGVMALVSVLAWAASKGASVIYTATDVVTMPTGSTFNAQILNSLGAFSASATVNFLGDLTPSTISTSPQTDYNPTNLATANILRLVCSVACTINGLATGAEGRWLIVINAGAQNVTLGNDAGTAANRFDFGADLLLPPKAMNVLVYDVGASRWRAISATLTGGTVQANILRLIQLGADPSAPPSGYIDLYGKTTPGVFARDPAGNVYGPFGAAGGGGSGTGITAVHVATTTNLDLSGTETVDGISVGAGGELVLVKDQTTASQNGIYVASTGAWTRSTSFDTSGEFVAGFPVYVQAGALNCCTVWNFSVIGAFTLGTTSATFVRTAPGTYGEVLVNKSTVAAAVSSGYIGADPNGNVPYNRVGSFAQHAPVSNASQITVTARQIGIECSSGTCDLTSSPQMVAGVANQEVSLLGTHDTRTVKLDNGTGLRLCGNRGSVVLGLNSAKVDLRYNSTLTVWEQINCQSLQSAWAVDPTIVADETRPFKICNAAGTSCKSLYVDSGTSSPADVNTCGGSTCSNTTVGPLPTSGKFRVLNNASAEIFVVNEAGTITGLTLPGQILTAVTYPGYAAAQCGAGSTQWAVTAQIESVNASGVDANMVITGTRTARRLRVKTTANVPSGETYSVTLYKNGSATAVACTIVQGAGTGTGEVSDSECADSSDTVALAAGDTIRYEVVCTGGTAAHLATAISMELEG